jgi:cytoskeletal protein CcmA (bactofilin family)
VEVELADYCGFRALAPKRGEHPITSVSDGKDFMTTIGASLTITGEVTSQEDITIHGSVKGQIRMKDGTLLVAPKGHIDAEVHGLRVTIHGRLAGDVAATERIELTPTADVTGTLTSRAIVLREGAAFNGMIDRTKN